MLLASIVLACWIVLALVVLGLTKMAARGDRQRVVADEPQATASRTDAPRMPRAAGF